MRYTKLHKMLAVVTAMGLIAVSPMAALADTEGEVDHVVISGEDEKTVDAVTNNVGMTGVGMYDAGGDIPLNGDLTVNGDVTVTNEASSISGTVTGVAIASSSDDGYAKLDVKGSVDIDATKGSEHDETDAFGIITNSKSVITVGDDVTAKANTHATGVITSNYGTTIDIGGSVTAECGANSQGVQVALYGAHICEKEEDNKINVNVGGDVTATGDTIGFAISSNHNKGNLNINVSGDVEAIGGYDSTGVFIQENSGSIDVKVNGDIKGTHDGIYVFQTGEEDATTTITAGGTISARNGVAVYICGYAGSKEADPEITAWKIESSAGNLVKVYTYGSDEEENEAAEERIKSNINYIIKADATEDGESSSKGKIVLKSVEGELGSVKVGDKTYETAHQDQTIIINVETAKGYKSTVQNNGTGTLTVNADGTYTLTIPEGGGVDLRAVLEKIEEQKKNSTRNSGGNSSDSSSSSSSGITPDIIYNESWSYDSNGWKLKKPDGNFASSEWRQVSWNGINNWYHFNNNGYADGGWLTDTDGHRYYLYNAHDGGFGRMLTGWNEIDGRWYYFNTVTTAAAPLGSLLTGGTTPDGYQVNADGAWVY